VINHIGLEKTGMALQSAYCDGVGSIHVLKKAKGAPTRELRKIRGFSLQGRAARFRLVPAVSK
jgi:hypothetical protein